MKSAFGKILFLCTSCLVFFAVLEIALRVRGYGTVGVKKGNVVHHRVGEFEHDAILNSLDLRDSEIPPKEPAEIRILMLGDSFTYGLGVNEEETFVRRTERLLRDRLRGEGRPGSIRVVNGGVGGGPFKEAEWLRDVGLALKPDLVVLGFFIGNDLYDDIAARRGESVVQNAGGGAGAFEIFFAEAKPWTGCGPESCDFERSIGSSSGTGFGVTRARSI